MWVPMQVFYSTHVYSNNLTNTGDWVEPNKTTTRPPFSLNVIYNQFFSIRNAASLCLSMKSKTAVPRPLYVCLFIPFYSLWRFKLPLLILTHRDVCHSLLMSPPRPWVWFSRHAVGVCLKCVCSVCVGVIVMRRRAPFHCTQQRHCIIDLYRHRRAHGGTRREQGHLYEFLKQPLAVVFPSQ